MRIYLDHNATTPLRDEVIDAMTVALRDGYGNPSSTHAEGAAARSMIDRARARVAAVVGALPSEVIFTGGATESNNTVLRGIVGTALERGQTPHLVTSTVEHPSVVEPCERLEQQGARVTRLEVDGDGLIDLDALDAALAQEHTALLSLIFANNETGVMQPLDEIAERAAARGVPLHIDATQALGKVPIDLGRVPVALLSCTAHKLNGPKGVGALIVREGFPGIEIPALLAGGPQEARRRGGTENVAGIVGFGVACELALREVAERGPRYAQLRDRLWEGIRAKIPDVRRNGPFDGDGPDNPDARVLPNTLNVEICGAPGEVLLQALDLEGVAASAGAACHSGAISPSHVLSAMGRSPEQARSTLRLSVGHGVDEGQIDRVVELLGTLALRARSAVAP